MSAVVADEAVTLITSAFIPHSAVSLPTGVHELPHDGIGFVPMPLRRQQRAVTTSRTLQDVDQTEDAYAMFMDLLQMR